MAARDTRDKLVTFPNERKASPRPKFRRPLIANPQAERNTLGALMLAGDPSAYGYADAVRVFDFLKPSDFADLRYQPIYEAMRTLHASGKAFGDLVQIVGWLNTEGRLSEAGGQPFVSSLINDVTSSNNVLDYARMVFDVWSQRETQKIATEGVQLDIPASDLIKRLREVDERRRLAEQEGAALPGQLLSDVQREAVHWAWYGRLAYGKATMIDGDGGKGKGLITLDLTARASTGRPMPGETEAAPPMNVILIAPEDSAADTLRPRLEAAGGDPSRVRLMAEIQDGAALRSFSIPRDVELLERTIEADGAGLVIIDPIMSCLDPGVKTHVDSEVRAALMPLKQAIERTGAMLIMVRHFTKASDGRAAYRGGGSVAFTNLARFGLVVGDHPDNPDVHVLALAKTNYEKVGSLAYRIVQGGGDVRIEWDTQIRQVDADTLLASHNTSEMRDTLMALENVGKPATVKEMLEHWPEGADKPTIDTLRRRMSRYADSRLVIKHAEGLYTLPNQSPTPSEDMSDMSDVSYMSDMSDMSDRSETGPDTSDSRTCRTGGTGSDTLLDLARCEHPKRARKVLQSGALACGLCSAHLDQASIG